MVLTNFIGNEVESRSYWPRGGILRGDQGGTCRVLTGPRRGGSPSPPPNMWYSGPMPTHSAPCRGYGARSAGMGPPFAAGWVPGIAPSYYPPGIPHPGTTPVYPPCTAPRRALAVIVMHSTQNSRFRDTVGEPRGVRTQPVHGSPAGYIQLFMICTAV